MSERVADSGLLFASISDKFGTDDQSLVVASVIDIRPEEDQSPAASLHLLRSSR